MFKKLTIFTMSALLAFAAFTTGCKKAEEKAEAETKAKAEAEAKAEAKENSPIAVVEKYLAIDSLDALCAAMPLCAPEYKEYINGQETFNYNMFVFIKGLNNAIKSDNPDKICQTYIDLIKDDDVWASVSAAMGMAAPAVSKRNMMVTKMQNFTPEQKQQFAAVMKEMMDTRMKGSADAGKNTKIIGSEINGDTATVSLVTAVTDPKEIAVIGKEVQKKISLKKIDGQWKITTVESTFAK